MPKEDPFPTQDEINRLPVKKLSELLGEGPAGTPMPKALLAAPDLISFLNEFGDFELKPRFLKFLTSPRLGLVSPPVRKDGRQEELYVFPYHYELLLMILTLRQQFFLPLNVIRELVKGFPVPWQDMVLDHRLSLEELLDMVKMLPEGFEFKELVMARACNAMIQDLLPDYEAVTLAMNSGDELDKKEEEELILKRLDEIKIWVTSGRKREFLRREASQDYDALARKRSLVRRIQNCLTQDDAENIPVSNAR
ncbi:MAG: hypothetical protein ABIG11_01805 [bacterium]